MRYLFIAMLLASSFTFAQVSPTLSASISAAQSASPKLFKKISANLWAIQKACEKTSYREPQSLSHIGKIKEKRRHQEIMTAMDQEINRINSSIPDDNSCFSRFFPMNLSSYAKSEGLDYLKDVKADIAKKNYKSCSKKLSVLLAEAQ